MRNYAEASAPGRICIAGEDIDWISGPSILCAVNLRTRVSVQSKNSDVDIITFQTGEPFNFIENVLLEHIGAYSGGVLDYVHASLRVITKLGITPRPMTIKVESELPARAGLGSSAAVCVASLAALSEFYELNLSDEQIAYLAYKVESEELQTGAGQMDMYSSALGGLIYLDSLTIPPHSIENYQLPEGLDIVIVDSITPRSTAAVIRDKRKRYNAQEPNFMKYVDETETAIQKLRTVLALQSTDVMQELGSLVYLCHAYIKDFLQVSTKLIDDCVEISMRNGALGAKLTGTGMGGCMFSLVPREMTPDVASSLQEKPVRVFVTSPSRRGVIRN